MQQLLLIVLSVGIVFSQDVLQKCQLESFGITDREDKIAKHFDALIKTNQEFPYECLEFLIQRGFYRTAVEVYENYFILNQIDIAKQLENLLSKDRSLQNVRELTYIFKHAFSQGTRVQVVQPIMVWAQSKNQTLINIKFSHRIDSPACINAKIEELSIQEDHIYLRAFGIVSHQPIKYEVRINLLKNIVPSLSTYKQEAVGTMVFNLTKTEGNDIWLRLTKEDVKTTIWWDLHDQLKSDMDEFVKLLEKESERKEMEGDKKYKKAQKKRQIEKEKQEKLAQIERRRQELYERGQCSIYLDRCENGWYQRQ